MKDFDAFATALLDAMRETINLDEEDLRHIANEVWATLRSSVF